MIRTISTDPNLKTALVIANHLYQDGTIKNIILANPKFDYTNQSSQSIAEAVQSFWATCDFTISTYRPWWRWSKAVATTNDDTGCQLNVYKYSRNITDLVDTIVHESIHGANFKVNPYMKANMAIFGHGDNSPYQKGNSVPYYVGDKVWFLVDKMSRD